MGAPQAGQCEPGWTTEAPRGRRWMHTFAKEPTTAPVAKNKPKRTPSAALTGASGPRGRDRRARRARPRREPRRLETRPAGRLARACGRLRERARPRGRGPPEGEGLPLRPGAPPTRG